MRCIMVGLTGTPPGATGAPCRAARPSPRHGLCRLRMGRIFHGRPNLSEPFFARTADPVALSIQGIKWPAAPQAQTPQDAGRGDGRGGHANADGSAGGTQRIELTLCASCSTSRNGGYDRMPIEPPASGTALFHCREKRRLLLGRPGAPGAVVLIHGSGLLSCSITAQPPHWLAMTSTCRAAAQIARLMGSGLLSW